MLIWFRSNFRWGMGLTALLILGTAIFSAFGQPASKYVAEPVPPANQTYVGTARCAICHRDQAKAWGETKHFKAYTDLPEMYRDDPQCLPCHMTGYGKWGGYVQGTDPEILKNLLDVGCEACHGPGSEHEKAAQRFAESSVPPAEAEKLEKALTETIYRIPPQNPCIGCHRVGVGHEPHPPYQGQPPAKTFPHMLVRTSTTGPQPFGMCAWSPSRPIQPESYLGMKACAACHYYQYRAWQHDKHSIATFDMPTKYQSDPQCLECHLTAYGKPGGYHVGTDFSVLANLLDVTCEACHGPGGKHVRFTRRFISGPPLSPELTAEARSTIARMIPADGCSRCHIRQSHKEHPKYEGGEKQS